MRKNVVVAIDGPAGAGKSTVARKIAKTLGFIHLNSGALFRAVGVRAIQAGISLSDEQAVAEIARQLSFEFKVGADGTTRLFVDGRDIQDELYTETAGEYASKIGTLGELRQVLLEVQRSVRQQGSIVVEGRDAGSVVFPDAEFKFYLDADLDVRVGRRLKQLREEAERGGEKFALGFEEVKAEMTRRDVRDSTREIAPSKQADDALLVDTSGLSAEEVLTKLVSMINN